MDYKKFIEHIKVAADAHQENVLDKKGARTTRTFKSGETVPYFLHPLWCSLMILMEESLPEFIRIPGSEALLFHDVLEDTSAELPKDISDEVKEMVLGMTFENFQDEVAQTLAKPAKAQLLKLYDKTATLYDGDLHAHRYPEWIDFMQNLIKNVEQEFGELNIVLLAKALIKKRSAEQKLLK